MDNIWKINRWYDDLEKRGMGGQRFVIFMGFIMPFMMLASAPWPTAMIIGWGSLCIIMIVRCYWLFKSGMKKRFPSKI